MNGPETIFDIRRTTQEIIKVYKSAIKEIINSYKLWGY